MGYASYLDSIRDRINTELHSLKVISNGDALWTEGMSLVQKSKALVAVCENLLRTVTDHIELASDPAVDLSHEIVTLRRENASLREENNAMRQHVSEGSALKIKVRDLQEENEDLKKQLTSTICRKGRLAGQLQESQKKKHKLEKEKRGLRRRR
jgi:predicted RNase H-like nuclease (RuvC/YqgF family)